MKIKIIIAFGVLCLGVGGWKIYNSFLKRQHETISYYGNIDTRTVMLGFRFLGQIKSISKDEGTTVSKGEKLVELDNSNLLNSLHEIESNIKAAEAELSKLKKGYRVEEIEDVKAQVGEAQANLNRTKDSFERQSRLIKTNATSQENYVASFEIYKQAEASLSKAKALYDLRKNGYRLEDIKVQEAKVESLQAQAKKLNVDLNDSVIVSPVNGVILTRFKEPGSIANPGENILELAKSDEFWVRAYVDEQNFGKIKPELKMLIYTDSRKEPYAGKVGFISPVAEFTPKNIQTEELRSDLVYRFRVIVQNPDNSLRQGMPVTLKAFKE